MPPRSPDRTNPREWLRTARSDLALARAGRPTQDVLYEQLCFHAQQAAEKAIKAILVSLQIDFPKTHEVGALLKLVEDRGIPVAEQLRALRAACQRSERPYGAVKILKHPSEVKWDYDEEADVLYLCVGEPKPASGVDIGEGVVRGMTRPRRKSSASHSSDCAHGC